MSKEIEAPNVVKEKKRRREEWLEEEILFEFFNLEEPGIPLKFSFGPASKPEKHLLLHGGKYRKKRALLQHLE